MIIVILLDYSVQVWLFGYLECSIPVNDISRWKKSLELAPLSTSLLTPRGNFSIAYHNIPRFVFSVIKASIRVGENWVWLLKSKLRFAWKIRTKTIHPVMFSSTTFKLFNIKYTLKLILWNMDFLGRVSMLAITLLMFCLHQNLLPLCWYYCLQW